MEVLRPSHVVPKGNLRRACVPWCPSTHFRGELRTANVFAGTSLIGSSALSHA